ncbi:putative NBD/HSP70 family sugar kinase [Variovorax beijingensis]|uniref:Putative NBD/HSP70 family sugar kinase n=1 Tax=Variovorax beijingensis TaxID=2496117 RepID=A0A561C166_9BURK|nr:MULTISPECIES: ROK family transcriptional regulator [Variovorax]MBD9664342.1 ROK family transcriptional regulator [Variovorax sp. VRV01]TWD84926.1 putative NBD/HSP70 family sugar kinase [Variovorax beijingensis]
MPDAEAPARSPDLLRPRGSNQVGMRQFNERTVLQALRVHTSLPKADLARLTGLSAQTIGLITARLEEDGLIIKQGRVRGRIGQPSVPLALNPDGAFAIGIKVGRRGAEWLLIDFTAKVRERHAISYDFPDADELLPAIAQHIHRLREGLGPLAVRNVGAGLAAPFQLGGWHRTLGLSKAQADLWNQMDLAAEVRARTELPVSFARDTVAACVAELVGGRGHDLKSFLYIFVDTFVGGGLVINSHLHTGAHGNAGALASLPMQPAQAGAGGALPPQVMAEASLWELEQRLQAQGLDTTAAYDDRALQAPFAAATQAWLGSASLALAHAIVSSTAVLDLADVVMDGSMSRSLLQALLEQTRAALARCNWEGLWAPQLHGGRVGAQACALGGAMLPLHANFAPDHDVFLKAA